MCAAKQQDTAFASVRLLLNQLKQHLASQPDAQLSQGGRSRSFWENGQPQAEARKGPPTRSANSSLGQLARAFLQLPGREQQTASPALVQQGHRRQRQVSPLNSPEWEVMGLGGSEYIFWVLHKVQEFESAQSSRQG